MYKLEFTNMKKFEAFWHMDVKNAGLCKSVLPCFYIPSSNQIWQRKIPSQWRCHWESHGWVLDLPLPYLTTIGYVKTEYRFQWMKLAFSVSDVCWSLTWQFRLSQFPNVFIQATPASRVAHVRCWDLAMNPLYRVRVLSGVGFRRISKQNFVKSFEFWKRTSFYGISMGFHWNLKACLGIVYRSVCVWNNRYTDGWMDGLPFPPGP